MLFQADKQLSDNLSNLLKRNISLVKIKLVVQSYLQSTLKSH